MISLADQANAAQVAGRLQHLIAADTVWMSGVGRWEPTEVEALGIVKDQLLASLRAVQADAPFLRRLGDHDDAGVERSLVHPQLPDDVTSSFRHVAERDGGYAKFVSAQLEALDSLIEERCDSIAADYERMRSGAPRPVRGGSDPTGVAIGIGLATVGGAISPALGAAGVVLVILSV